MQIEAIQKTTLLDYPGKIACTVFLSGCNLRCPFCHNAGLVIPEQIQPSAISSETLFSFLQKRKGKLDGVCITGGEPTLQQDLPWLIHTVKEMGFLVKLDTNGSNPRMLHRLLCDNLLDYVAMDLKNDPEHYAETCGGINILDQVNESVHLLLSSSVDYEFRTTVFKPMHTAQRICNIGHWIKGAQQYFLQGFVDSGHLIGSGMSPMTKEEMIALQKCLLDDVPNTQIRGYELRSV